MPPIRPEGKGAAVPAARHLQVILGLIVVSVVGCNGSAPPAAEKAPPAPVTWEAPIQGALAEWTELIGTTVPVPDRVARITAPVEGRVVSVFGDAGPTPIVEGQRVEKGTPLVLLDAAVIQASIAKTEAAQEVLHEEERQA